MPKDSRAEYVRKFHVKQDRLIVSAARAIRGELKRCAEAIAKEFTESHGNRDSATSHQARHAEEMRKIIDDKVTKPCVKGFWLFGVPDQFKKMTKADKPTLGATTISAAFETQLEWDVYYFLLDNTTATITGLADTTIAEAAKTIAKGMDEGLTQKQIAAKIVKDVSGVSTRWRAALIARTEVHKASNMSQHESIIRTFEGVGGIKVEKEWISAHDARTRDNHRQADGQHVIIDGKFKVGGELMSHPGDPRASAKNVCNCRCTTGYDYTEV